MTTIAERVAKGAVLLDREEPGWEQRIDLDTLTLADPCRCVLGQLFSDRAPDADEEPYYVGVTTLGVDYETDDLGFNDAQEQYGPLTCAWKALIRERRSQAAARPAEGQGEG